MNNRYSTYHTLIGYRMYNRTFFPHRLRMSVSYPEAGMSVRTFSRFRIRLRLRRPHEPSSGPPGRPSSGKVLASGHGSGRSKRKGSPRVEKRAAKRGDLSVFHADDHAILLLLNLFMPLSYQYHIAGIYHFGVIECSFLGLESFTC